MNYLVSWGRDEEREVATAEEMDAVLREIAGERTRVVVGVYRKDAGRWVGMDVGIGHPERSFVFFNDRHGGYGSEPGIEAWDGDISFDDGGRATDYHPEETRVLAETAMRAAQEYVTTGQQPTCVVWQDK